MKVKEKYSKDFKKTEKLEDFIGAEYPKQIILKEKDNISLLETIKKEGELLYSSYNLYDAKYNVSYVRFFIPNPRENDEAKDFFLKYQHGMRRFMKDFFDVYTGEKEDISPIYKKKQKKDMTYEISENGFSVLLNLITSGKLVGIIELETSSKEKNLKIAKSIIKYFEGIPLNKTWRKICEQ